MPIYPIHDSEINIRGADLDTLKTLSDQIDGIGTGGATQASVDAIQVDVGNPSIRTNLQSLETMLGNPDTAGSSIYTKMAKEATLGTMVNTGGTADLGSILGDFANVTLVSRLNTIAGYIDAEVASIKTETDQIGTIVNTGGTPTIGALFGDFANTSLVSRLNTIAGYIDTEVGAIQTDIGDPSARTNLQSIEAMLGNPDTAGSSIYTKMAKDASIGTLVNTGGTATIGAMYGDFNNISLVTRLGVPVTSVSADIAAIKSVVDTINLETDLVASNESTGTFVYDGMSGGEQTIFTIATTTRKTIQGIWIDMTNLTQNGIVRVSYKIDGANYRLVDSFDWNVTTDNDGFFIGLNMGITNDFKVSYEASVSEGADINMPYSTIYDIRE